MTEAGEKWRLQQIETEFRDDVVVNPETVEFWIRAFCDEVQRNGENGRPHVLGYKEIGKAFYELKLGLLGE